jgi:hypothetical protein
MMTATQFSKALDKIGITQHEAAQLLRVHPRTTRRWANDEREIPGPVFSYLDMLTRNKASRRFAIESIRAKARA